MVDHEDVQAGHASLRDSAKEDLQGRDPGADDTSSTSGPTAASRAENADSRPPEGQTTSIAKNDDDTVLCASDLIAAPRVKRVDAAALVGRRLGRFEVRRSIGRGGMGYVYDVFDPQRELRLALKRLIHVDGRHILRFKREFRALRDVRHPNLVTLDELFEEDGHWCFTMELVPGIDFLSYVRGLDPSEQAEVFPHSETGEASSTGSSGSGSVEGDDEGRDAAPEAPAGPADPQRLRSSLAQLALGLQHLHRAGKVHRDVKPSNILVTAKGRVVVLDLGVVAEFEDGVAQANEVVGTYAYMAPEQRRGEAVTPAADWYAVGVLLYQALTGKRLNQTREKTGEETRRVTGEESRVLLHRPAQPTREDFPPDGPASLIELCRHLLAVDPTKRAGAAEMLRVLGDGSVADAQTTFSSWWSDGCFVGRTAELETLGAAFDEAAGRQRIVTIEGESGIGKSTLVSTFIRRTTRSEPDLLVLRGRCHERERLPYNALDGVVDALGRWLDALSPEALDPLVDANSSAMMQVFPTLRAVDALTAAALKRSAVADLDEARTRAFAGLRSLLAKVAAQQRLIVILDDVQWADADSLALLEELTAGSAPPHWLLVCLAQRPAGREACPVMEALHPRATTLTLQPLDERDARAMTKRLAKRLPGTLQGWAKEITKSAAGHPMFIEQLLQHALTSDMGDEGLPKLEDAVRRRARALGPDAHALLHVIAAAAAPIEHRVVMAASGLAPGPYAEAVGALVGARLARVVGSRARDTVETYHDKIRRSLYGELEDAPRRAVHLEIARAMVAADGDPDAIAIHFAQTDEAHETARYAVEAAQRAAAGLAFDRAVELYELALGLDVHSFEDRRDLSIALGDALAEAGRPEAAATAYETAASMVARGELRLELRRRATHQLLAGGYVDRGTEAARSLLREVGERLPTHDAAFLSRLLYHSVRSNLGSLKWTPRRAEDLPQRVLTQMDVEWSVGAGFSMVDTLRGAMFFARAPRLALAHGEPFRVCRALTAAAISASSLGRKDQAERLLAATKDAAAKSDHPLAPFYASIAGYSKAFLIDNDWASARDGAQKGLEAWSAAGRGHGWEFDVLQQFYCWSLNLLGEYGTLQRKVPELIRSARRSGNRFLEVSLQSFFAPLHLCDDEPERARKELDDALAHWIPPDRSFGNQHYWGVRSGTYIAIYRGDLRRDEREIEAKWARVDKSLVGRVAMMRMESAAVGADWRLARAVEAKARNESSVVRAHLAAVESSLSFLEKSQMPATRPLPAKLRAAIAGVRGDDETAVFHLRQCITELERAGTLGVLSAVKRRLGLLLGGDEGAALVAEADGFFTSQGVASPARFGGTLLTGWPMES